MHFLWFLWFFYLSCDFFFFDFILLFLMWFFDFFCGFFIFFYVNFLFYFVIFWFFMWFLYFFCDFWFCSLNFDFWCDFLIFHSICWKDIERNIIFHFSEIVIFYQIIGIKREKCQFSILLRKCEYSDYIFGIKSTSKSQTAFPKQKFNQKTLKAFSIFT